MSESAVNTESEFNGKVAIVTGAGGGIGRCHAIEFAKRGAKVVVNDLGGGVDGTGAGDAADAVVAEIVGFGGAAIANKASVADRDGAKSIADDAIAAFGRIDILVNNAGILRDRTFKNMTLDEFDLVMQVHLTALPTSPTPCGRTCTSSATGASSSPVPAPASSATSGNPTTAPPRWGCWASPTCSRWKAPTATSA